jgi:tRNA nucleotidyltransferase/poly(A) polymerase
LILRFFKLLSMFVNPKFDKSLLPLMSARMKSIRKLKPERIELELSNIAKGPSAEKARNMLRMLGFDQVMAEKKAKMEEAANPLNIVPALKITTEKGERIFPARFGDTHADIWVRLDPETRDNASIDDGFVDEKGHYLTRQQAARMVGAYNSRELQQVQLRHMAQGEQPDWLSGKPSPQQVRSMRRLQKIKAKRLQAAESVIIENLHDLVPAIAAELPDGSRKIFPGTRADNHGVLYDRFYDDLMKADAGNVDSGFFNMKTGEYLTRQEAQALLKATPGVDPRLTEPHKKHLHAGGLRAAVRSLGPTHPEQP